MSTDGLAVLMDEHQTPPLRATIGRFLSCARSADFAVAHLRLAGLDLTPGELGSITACRVLIARLDADSLMETAEAAQAQEQVSGLLSFALSGRLQIRALRQHVWTPDFSVFHGLPPSFRAPASAAAMVGAHYFGRPYPVAGLALTCVLTKRAAVRRCALRFDQLWGAGYDVLDVVADTLQQLLPVP